MIGALMVSAARGLRRTDWRRGIALGGLGMLAHLAAHSFFDKLYVNNLFLVLGAVLGMISGLLVRQDS
jgi:hypothetical protein